MTRLMMLVLIVGVSVGSLAAAQDIDASPEGELAITAILIDEDLSLRPVPRAQLRVTGAELSPDGVAIVTSFQGEADVPLVPGDYRLMSEAPVEFRGHRYTWDLPFSISEGRTTSLDLSNDNATITGSATREPQSEVDLYRQYSSSVFKISSESGSGSGFLVDESGLVVTNHHVVQGSGYLAIQIDELQKYPANLLAFDEVNDIAVLRIHSNAIADRIALPILEFDRNAALIETGERVLAIGSPLSTETILTSGIVSKVETSVILSDVSINPGNSGGPLFNSRGEVVGINTFGLTSSGPGVSGIVRIHLASPVVEEAMLRLSEPPPPNDLVPMPSRFTFPAAELRDIALQNEMRFRDYHLEAREFDVTFIDPVLIAALQLAACRTDVGGSKVKKRLNAWIHVDSDRNIRVERALWLLSPVAAQTSA